jgi:hypothetical protein
MLHLLTSSSGGEGRALISEVPVRDFITEGVSPRRDVDYMSGVKPVLQATVCSVFLERVFHFRLGGPTNVPPPY